MERRDHTLRVDGLALHVIEWGERGAPPVLMLHGIRGFAETFAALAGALVPAFRVIAYDQRGRGDSDWDPDRRYHTLQYVADLESVADALGLARFDLLGHSMGGIAALVFASRYPKRVRRMVVEDAGPGAFANSPGAARIRRELAEAPTEFSSWEEALAYMRRLRPTVTPQALADRMRSMLRTRPDGTLAWRHDHAGITAVRLSGDAGLDVDLWPCVRALQMPTLLLRGARSDYLDAETAARMADANALLEWTQIPAAGHYVHDDNPDATIAAVRAFLSREPAQGAAP